MKKLYPFQVEGSIRIRSILSQGRNALLADEMGLGKTVQAINAVEGMYDVNHVLVVCPLSLVQNWKSEILRWSTRGEWFVCHYEALRKSPIYSQDYDLLIVDEAHYIKNEKTLRHKAVAGVKCRKLVMITGTPIDNRPKELWPLLKMLDPGVWNHAPSVSGRPLRDSLVIRRNGNKSKHSPAFMAYAKRYCAAKLVRIPGKYPPKKAWDFSGASNLSELNARLRSRTMIRRTKKEVLSQLPAKQRQVVLWPSLLQDNSFLMGLTTDDYDAQIAMLQCNPIKFAEFSRVRHDEALSKVPILADYIDDVALEETGKVLVFAHHLDVIEALREALVHHNPAVLTGPMPFDEREDAVRRFQNDNDCKVFIGSIGAAGVGLNLTAASLVIFAELDPSPARMSQCEDRAHRIGQKNMVVVRHVVRDGSIDARIAKILIEKQRIVDEVVR